MTEDNRMKILWAVSIPMAIACFAPIILNSGIFVPSEKLYIVIGVIAGCIQLMKIKMKLWIKISVVLLYIVAVYKLAFYVFSFIALLMAGFT